MRQGHIIKRHIRNNSTNQVAGNSLFSSEVILIIDQFRMEQLWLIQYDKKMVSNAIHMVSFC